MLGREKLFWIGAWIKQDKLWMEQGHARGFAFTAVAAALSGCSGTSPQQWTGRETILVLRDRSEKRGQGMGLLETGAQSRNLAGSGSSLCVSGHKEWSCQWEKCFHDPGRQGANAAEPKPSPTMPQPGFWGTAREQGEPLCSPGILGHCQQRPLSIGASLTPAGKWHCHSWVCHREPGNCQGQRCERGAQLRGG